MKFYFLKRKSARAAYISIMLWTYELFSFICVVKAFHNTTFDDYWSD